MLIKTTIRDFFTARNSCFRPCSITTQVSKRFCTPKKYNWSGITLILNLRFYSSGTAAIGFCGVDSENHQPFVWKWKKCRNRSIHFYFYGVALICCQNALIHSQFGSQWFACTNDRLIMTGWKKPFLWVQYWFKVFNTEKEGSRSSWGKIKSIKYENLIDSRLDY